MLVYTLKNVSLVVAGAISNESLETFLKKKIRDVWLDVTFLRKYELYTGKLSYSVNIGLCENIIYIRIT